MKLVLLVFSEKNIKRSISKRANLLGLPFRFHINCQCKLNQQVATHNRRVLVPVHHSLIGL